MRKLALVLRVTNQGLRRELASRGEASLVEAPLPLLRLLNVTGCELLILAKHHLFRLDRNLRLIRRLILRTLHIFQVIFFFSGTVRLGRFYLRLRSGFFATFLALVDGGLDGFLGLWVDAGLLLLVQVVTVVCDAGIYIFEHASLI